MIIYVRYNDCLEEVIESASFVDTVREVVLVDGSRIRVPNSAEIVIEDWTTGEVPF